MILKFNASSMAKYMGADGLGEVATLVKDQCKEFSPGVAKILLMKYPKDFQVVIKEKPDHAPKEDKMAKRNYKNHFSK